MRSQRQAWTSVPLPWFDETTLNPAVEAGQEGIEIWAPDQVSLEAGRGRIPLFGTVQFGEETLREAGILDRHPLRAVVVGIIPEGVYSPLVGNAVLQAALLPPEGGPVVREYFAVDLAECTGWRPGVADLHVFASVTGFVAPPRALSVVR